MNIFVLSIMAKESAEMHCDIHCVKMILESVQLLYSVWWFYFHNTPTAIENWNDITPYKMTHINHPCSIWARYHKNHYNWLIDLCETLCNEYTTRYHKVHKSYEHLLNLKQMGYPNIDKNLLTIPHSSKISRYNIPSNCEFFLCAIDNSIFDKIAVYNNNMIDCVETYRNYYKYKKDLSFKRTMKWSRSIPVWI